MFIELHTRTKTNFLFNPKTGWEIHDRQDNPAHWENNDLGMNKNCGNTYSEIKQKLIDSENLKERIKFAALIRWISKRNYFK